MSQVIDKLDINYKRSTFVLKFSLFKYIKLKTFIIINVLLYCYYVAVFGEGVCLLYV